MPVTATRVRPPSMADRNKAKAAKTAAAPTAKAPAANEKVIPMIPAKVALAALAPKKKPAKKPKKISHAERVRQDYAPDKLPGTVSRVLAATMKAAQAKYHDPTICVATEAAIKVIGVPLPSLAMEYIIQNTVWPCERVAQIVGREGTCKSFLTFEIARWFHKLGGGAYLFENESKYSPEAAMSVLGYDEEVLGYIPCDNLEDWQAKMQFFVAETKKNMKGPSKKEKGPGKVYPMLYILDSLMGKLSAESMQAIETDGFAKRMHPLEAMKVTSFLKTAPSLLQRWPFALVVTNHLKKKTSTSGGPPERSKAGGVHIDFQETFELQLNRCAKFHIKTTKYEGVALEMRCYKNSLGTTGRRMLVDVHWWNAPDPKTGRMRQITKWQWHAATTRLLLGMQTGELGEPIKAVCDLRKGTGNCVYSKKLKAIKKPISFHEAGLRIHKDKEMKRKLRNLLGIKTRKVFQKSVDYDQQLKIRDMESQQAADHAGDE